MEGGSTKKGEVRMGGKCKMLGAAALLDTFERKVDVETTVEWNSNWSKNKVALCYTWD